MPEKVSLSVFVKFERNSNMHALISELVYIASVPMQQCCFIVNPSVATAMEIESAAKTTSRY